MSAEERRQVAHVRQMGFKHAYIVGGAERARELGVPSKDVDIAVAGHSAEDLLAIAGKEGTVKELRVAGKLIGVRLTAPWTPPEGIEIALARTEVATGGGRHAFAVTAHPDVTIEEDLLRRDFTCNAIARDIYSYELIDPLGGAQDIAAGVLRTVSEKSFPEDPLRVMRGLVRCAKDGLRPEPGTFAQMAEWAQDPKRYMRGHADELIVDYVATAEAELGAKGIDRYAALAGKGLEPGELGDHPGLVVLMEEGLYRPGEGLDRERLKDWAPANIDDAGRPRAVFEAATGYRWYGDVPLSPERVYEETCKLLAGDDAAESLRIARRAGALGHILPELGQTVGFEQMSKFHDMTVDEHTLLVLQRATEHDAPLSVRLAAVLHDTAKPSTAWGWVSDGAGDYRPASVEEFRATPDELKMPGDEHLHFYARPPVKDGDTVIEPAGEAHEDVGAENARQAMNRFAAPTELKNKVVLLVREHMYRDDDEFTTLAESAQARRARRFLQRVGADNVEELMLLRRCDRGGKRASLQPGWDTDINAFEAAVRRQVELKAAVSVNDLAANGKLFAQAGFRGPAIGEVRRRLLDLVIEDPELNTSERLMELAADMRADVEAAAAAHEAARIAEKRARGEAAREAARLAKAAAQATS